MNIQRFLGLQIVLLLGMLGISTADSTLVIDGKSKKVVRIEANEVRRLVFDFQGYSHVIYGADEGLFAISGQTEVDDSKEREERFRQRVHVFDSSNGHEVFTYEVPNGWPVDSHASLDNFICVDALRGRVLFLVRWWDPVYSDPNAQIRWALYVIDIYAPDVRLYPFADDIGSKHPFRPVAFGDVIGAASGGNRGQALYQIDPDSGTYTTILDSTSAHAPQVRNHQDFSGSLKRLDLLWNVPKRFLFLDQVGMYWTNGENRLCQLSDTTLAPLNVLEPVTTPFLMCDVQTIVVNEKSKIIYGVSNEYDEFYSIGMYDPLTGQHNIIKEFSFKAAGMKASATKPIVRMFNMDESVLVQYDLEKDVFTNMGSILFHRELRILGTF